MESANPSSTLGSFSQEPSVTTHAKFTARINKLLEMRQTIDSILFKTINESTNQSSDSEIFCPDERIKELELRTQRRNNFEEELFKDRFPTKEELAYHDELLGVPQPPFSTLEPKIKRGDPWSLKIPYVIGTVYKGYTYIDVQSLVNIMSRAHHNKIREKSFQACRNPYQPYKFCNFVGRAKNVHIFIGSFIYVVDFMILEDMGSIIDSGLGEVVFGKPFVHTSKLTYDESLGLIRFVQRDDEVMFRMPQRTKELDLVSSLEKYKFEAFFVESLKVFSIWKAFGGNTSDLGSFGEEMDKTTDLHQHLSRISPQRIVLAIAALRNLEVHQMDVKTEFLNEDLEEEIYMNQPEGFIAPGQESKVCTRPDLAYAVSRLSRYTSNPSNAHWKAMTMISDIKDSRSTSGYVFTLGGAAMSWKSSKQTVIAKSTIESEFIALDKCGEEAEWLRQFVEDIPMWPIPNFKRWHQKMFFYLTTLNLVRFLNETTPQVEPPKEGQPSNGQAVQAVEAWKHLEFLCHNYVLNGLADSLYNVYCKTTTAKELWELLECKYKTEDTGTKKFVVAHFLDYKMVDSKNVITQVQDLQVLLHGIHAEGMTLSETFQVATIIEKLPPSWVEFKNYLKHKRKEMSVKDLVVRLRIEEDNKLAQKSTYTSNSAKANMVEHVGSSSKSNSKSSKGLATTVTSKITMLLILIWYVLTTVVGGLILRPLDLGSFDVIIGMDWLIKHRAVIVCDEKLVRIPFGNETLTIQGSRSEVGITEKKTEIKSKEKRLDDILIVCEFPEVFPEDLLRLPLTRQVEFQIDLVSGAALVARSPYRLAP
ncbi:retrovirus-related pol polyprotein from transposon TNT 1-94 [Tanacetum coccineum]|uniref:Retrovirus-related pol polyprotein from transposon TNT 1-94 n=1 Tax=Tanacetum coccineum TaxID=301880 RepID=A0ABQ5J744_9ASTR